MDINQEAFFAILRAGLWESNVQLSTFEGIDYHDVYRLSEEQSVVGLILAGIERLKSANASIDLSQVQLLQWIGEVQMIEQRNKATNAFVADLIEKLRKQDVYTLLLKGQGIAQCYEKPLWRTCGDVDLLLSYDNYCKAKEYLTKIASHVDAEREDTLHLGMTIDSWVVELHGSLRCGLLKK